MKKKKMILIPVLMGMTIFTGCTGSTQESRGIYEPKEDIDEPEVVTATPTDAPTPTEEPIDPGVIDEPQPVEMTLTIDRIQLESVDKDTREDLNEPYPYAYTTFAQINLSGDAFYEWRGLQDTLENINSDVYDKALSDLADAYELYCSLDEDIRFYSCLKEADVYVLRADERVLSFRTAYYLSYDGPHPSMWDECRTFDPETGRELTIDDVIDGPENMEKLTDLIWDNLIACAVGDDYEFEDDQLKMIRSNLEDIVADRRLVWGLDSDGLVFYFDSDALMSYAFGPFEAAISYADYPGFVKEKYLPTECSSLSKRVTYTDVDTVYWDLEGLLKITGRDTEH